jgi:hypothetical protein
MEGEELEALVASIKEHGLRRPITLLDDKILDGRNRYRACLLAKVEPATRNFRGGDPLAFVVDENVCRRHLDESQRAMVAAKMATLSEGRPLKTAQICAVSQDETAKRLNVGRRCYFAAPQCGDIRKRIKKPPGKVDRRDQRNRRCPTKYRQDADVLRAQENSGTAQCRRHRQSLVVMPQQKIII